MKFLNLFWIHVFIIYFFSGINAEVLTPGLADFIEFHTALRYCKSSSSKEQNDFDNCVSPLIGSSITGIGDLWKKLCANKQAYYDCWKPIVEKSLSCNKGSARGPPSLYRASLQAICGIDGGKSAGDGMDRALEQITTQQCSASGDHWMDACAFLESDMSSTNSCKKFRALSKCTDKIICKEQPAGKYLLDLYKKVGKILGC